MDQWSLQDAKNRLSHVVDQALSEHRPQIITRRGKNTAVVIAYEDYLKLASSGKSLLERLLPAEPIGIELEITRDDDFGREISL